MEPITASPATALSASGIDELPWQPLGVDGVEHKVLWHDTSSMAGILRVSAGHRLGGHTHRANHHHMWILEGRAEILGRVLGPGSYVHIPSGVEHDIDAFDSEGCTLYYLYLRPDDADD